MAIFCGFCGWRSARLGLGITPDSAEYHFRQWQAQPERSVELDRALTLNPRYTAGWIARGLAAETAGDPAAAEASLLQAARTDKTYLPGWTLANFYLRADDAGKFWTWARRAAGMAHDPTAVFQLCWRKSGDAGKILDRAIPAAPAVRRAYLDFLLRTNRFEAAGPLAAELGRTPEASDLDALLGYCDASLARHEVGPALRIWNALSKAGLIPYRQGAWPVNGDLAAAPLGRGFDWRPQRIDGVSLTFDPAARAMAVAVSGRQPESCDLVEQYIAVQPGARYRFRFDYRTPDLGPGNGLSWSFVDARTGAELAAVALSGQGGQSLEFSSPGGCDLISLQLRYRRPAGSVRAEGSVEFQRFTLERAD
jgi:hypothetical protein